MPLKTTLADVNGVEAKILAPWDYYAAGALSGLLAASPTLMIPAVAANAAAAYADELLRERAARGDTR